MPQAGQARLETYRAKRDFKKTAEPEAKIARRRGNQFVVQRHDARRLHFDLRLELDGVLKSWAVTRGPSLVPGEKRLAVQTEDHPMQYLEWEGVIPQGEYGGGTMIVWDRGTWMPDGDPREGLAKGKLVFTLAGERLKGAWHLVRMQRKAAEKKDSWLLMKSRDEHARGADDPQIVEEELTSHLTGRTNEDLARGRELRPDHAARAKVKAKARPAPSAKPPKGARKGILPPFVEPSFAMLQDKAPSGDNWLHEIKFDGYRLQARLDGGKVTLLTRNGLDWTERFAPIAAALRKLAVGSALIDGELVVQDESGLSSFSALQMDLKASRKDRLAYFAFDLLYHEGMDLRGAPLLDRKERLQQLLAGLPKNSTLRFSDHIQHDGHAMLGEACRMGLEGIVSKRADLPYVSGRGPHWIKSKCANRQELVVIGYLPSTAMKHAVGSLVLGYYDRGKLVHAGRAGTGFPRELAADLYATLERIAAAKPAFDKKPPPAAEKGVRWVAPELVAEIEFRGWTHDGLLRQAAFKGLREDKPPKEIRRERSTATMKAEEPDPLARFHLTHPDRVLWEEQGVTKRGLAEFYAGIADWILPHVTGRVLSLVRCPSGAEAQCFYAKHAWKGMGEAIRRADVGEGDEMVMIEDLEGLIALVQAGVLEIHPWGSRASDLERPDRITMDLDPGPGVAWSAVIDAALELRRRLKDAKLESFLKTSGGKGLHVVVPLTPKAGWDQAKDFAKSLAEAMAADDPQRYVAVMAKNKRADRIFIDYLRNGRGATAVAAYSTRAKPQAPVSTPLDWSELSEAITSAHFTVANLRQRLDHLSRDPWRDLAKIKQTLPAPRRTSK